MRAAETYDPTSGVVAAEPRPYESFFSEGAKPSEEVVTFVNDVTDPYLRLFRRVIPPVGGGGFALDLSPIVAIIVLYIAQAVVVGLIRG